jgi:hypothetical protein
MKATKTEFLLERHSYDYNLLTHLGFSDDSITFFVKNKILINQGFSYIFDFVGFLYINDKEFFVCPKYRKTVYEQSIIPKFKNLFQSFNTEVVYSDSLYTSKTLSETILVDFMKNKYFKEEQMVFDNDWNSVSWEDLILDCDNFHNGHPVILEPKTFSKTNLIHHKMVKMQDSFISLLISKNNDLIQEFSLPHSYLKQQLFSEEEMLNYFRSELKKNRLYREKRMMKLYIDFLSVREQEFQFFGTKFFHIIWEKICKFVFNDQTSIYKKHFPKPTYQIGDKIIKLKGHIPDIISVPDPKSCFVLDAKYYDIEKGLPQTEDVTKQLFYEKLCKNILPNHSTSNGFLFLNEQDEDIMNIGKLTYDVFEQKNITLYSLKDIFVLSLFCDKKHINPKMLPL